jgi:glycosyltransferase involved in cell wall biosynthesis
VVPIASRTLPRVPYGHESETKLRVVHVAPTPFGAPGAGILGGGERYPLELALAVANDVECELISFGRPDVRRVDGLVIRTLPAPIRLGGHPAHPIAPSLPAALASADIIHVHHMLSAPSRVAAVTGAARRQPVVVTDHGLAGGSWAGVLPRLFDAFLLVSKYSAAILRTPAVKTRVIYGGVDVRRFHPDPDAARRDVLFVGRLTPHKGIDVLIRALPTGARLVVVGSEGHDPRPPEREYPQLLRGLARGRDVRFLGPVSDEALRALYANAAAVVLPSVHRTCFGRFVAVSELLGLVALEAMACGTPVIASRIGGVPEVVEDGVTGFLVEPGDVGQLGERISQLLANDALRSQLGGEGRKRVIERFTWRACAERCVTAYGRILADRGR